MSLNFGVYRFIDRSDKPKFKNRRIFHDTHWISHPRKTRNHQVAYTFMKKLVKTFEEPKVLIIDKAPY